MTMRCNGDSAPKRPPFYFSFAAALLGIALHSTLLAQATFTDNILSVPVVQVGSDYYWLELALIPNTEPVELQAIGADLLSEPNTVGASLFANSQLYIPALQVGGVSYYGVFALVSDNPVTLRLTEAGIANNQGNPDTRLTPLTPEFSINSVAPYDQSSPIASMADDRSFVVVYLSEGQGGPVNTLDLFARLFDSDGNPKGVEFEVADLNAPVDSYNEQQYDLSLADDGTFVVAWSGSGSDRAVYASVFTIDGAPLAERILVDNQTESEFNYNVTASIDDGGSFAVAYDSFDGMTQGIKLRRFTLDGTAFGDAFWVDEAQEIKDINLSLNSSGDMILVWHEGSDDGDVYGRRLNPGGGLIGETKFRINDETEGSQDNARVVIADDGTFVVVWQSDQTAAPGIYMQRFSGEGVPVGLNQLVASEQGFDNSPAVSGSEEGLFVVVWSGFGSEGASSATGMDVWAQLYDLLGTALGDPIKVNTVDQDDQQDPRVAIEDNNGSVLIVWTDFWQEDVAGNGDGVRARLFSLQQTTN